MSEIGKQAASQLECDGHYELANDLLKLVEEIAKQKAIADLAVKALERIDSLREAFPASFDYHHVSLAFVKAERFAASALEEIQRTSTEGVSP